MILKSSLGGLLMWCQDILIFDLVIIKESIGGFCNAPRATGLRDGERRVIGKDVGNQSEAFGETQVA